MMTCPKKTWAIFVVVLVADCVVSRCLYAQEQSADSGTNLSGNPAANSSKPAGADSNDNVSIEDQLIKQPNRSNGGTSSSSAGFRGSWGKTWLALGVVLAIILACAYVFRRAWPGHQRWRSCPGVEILGRTYISPKQNLCLVRLGKNIVLLGVSADRITSLAKLDDPDQVAALLGQVEQDRPNSATAIFSHLFSQQEKQYRKLPSDDAEVADLPEDGLVLQVKGQLSSLLDRVGKMKGSLGRE